MLLGQAMREAKMFALSSQPGQQRVAEQKKRGARLLAKEVIRGLHRREAVGRVVEDRTKI